jgi:ankyrin repeat protein
MLNLREDDPHARATIAAIRTGDVERLRQLLAETAELARSRVIDAHGISRSLLHVVADWPGHFANGAQTVATLVAAGADVDAVVTSSKPAGQAAETPLHWAASSDDTNVLSALIAHGANIEAPGAVFTGGTPMSDAVVFAQWRAARMLLDHGASTTIWQAAALGLLDRVMQCCDGAPRPPTDQRTNAFWHACRGGQRKTAAYLLSLGADLNWVGHDHKTPLQAARESGGDELVRWLRSQGAKDAHELR